MEREAKSGPLFIHARDYQWLLDSDVGVFEISHPSLGVGSEISDMIHAGKPVLMLFKRGLENKVSAYLRGKVGSKYVTDRVPCLHGFERSRWQDQNFHRCPLPRT